MLGVPLEALWPAALLGAFVILLGLVLAHELGPNGAWARSKQASENLRDVAERAAERDPHSSTGRPYSVLGSPRDWSESA